MAGREIELGEVGEAVATRLRELRVERKLSHTALSALLQNHGRRIPANGISNIEARRRRVDVDDLVAFARVFEVDPDDILGWESIEVPIPDRPYAGVERRRKAAPRIDPDVREAIETEVNRTFEERYRPLLDRLRREEGVIGLIRARKDSPGAEAAEDG